MKHDTVNSKTCIDIHEQLISQCQVMIKHALASGQNIPSELASTILLQLSSKNILEGELTIQKNREEIRKLIYMHSVLCDIVKPALPGTLMLLDKEKKSGNYLLFLGPVTIVRELMIACILSIVCFILLSLSPYINAKGGAILTEDGLPLLVNLLLFLSAAGLGAGFSGLYKANSFIAKGTFNPDFNASYRSRYVLGLVSGLVLAILIKSSPSSSQESELGDFFDPTLLRILLSVVGGFSADLFYTLMLRLIETLNFLFQGNSRNEGTNNSKDAAGVITLNTVQHSQEEFKVHNGAIHEAAETRLKSQ